MTSPAMEALAAAFSDPATVAARLRGDGCRVVRVLGPDAPFELLRAGGLAPVRLVADHAPTPRADRLIGTSTLSQQGRSLLEQIITDESGDALLVTHAEIALPQVFAALRELMLTGELARRPIHFLDLLHMPRATTLTYNRVRIEQLTQWIAEIGAAALSADAWQRALAIMAETQALLVEAKGLRDAERPLIAGAELLAMIGSADVLPPTEWQQLMQSALREATRRAPLPGQRVVLAGSPQPDSTLQQRLQQAGYHVVGDFHDWGDPRIDALWGGDDWQLTLAEPRHRAPAKFVPASARMQAIAAQAKAAGAAHLLYLVAPGDEVAAWDAGVICRQLADQGLQTMIWDTAAEPPAPGQWRASTSFAPTSSAPDTPTAPQKPVRAEHAKADSKSRTEGQRSRKTLTSVATFSSYQREWFAGVRAQMAAGSPFGVVNANSPQEILRAMEIPFVVNQWWAAIVAAKQQSGRYFDLLRSHGYPADAEAYSSQGLAALFDDDEELAPWGGLPKPDFVHAVLSTDATPRLFEHWACEAGAELFLFERSAEPRLDIAANWWETLPEQWDEEVEAVRLDLMTAELRSVIRQLEQQTGRRFDDGRFRYIMQLVNEQEAYYRQTRDLIARTYPAPVGIVDTMPATMVPQWHRGTEWARDAARAFYEEVKARVDASEAACPNEQIRLMWLGRGMWSDMAFYQRWEQSHGAVFIWSMYLALAADGYIRAFDNDRDPLRALAARFVTMGDELRMPTWAGAWHVHEARTHGVDGAVALSDADPFVIRALERAGIPVLALDLDNYNQESSDAAQIDRQIAAFLEGAAAEQSALRRGGAAGS